ncbi:MAG: hypothetical protein JW986_10650 [Methanotrichaceae archaeon]|nr:hypothetical protein [Methanotrichaceae archaeon]
MSEKRSESVPVKMRPIYDEITALTDAVCSEHLDEDYALLARRMAAALARKRPSPLERGKMHVWAAAIVYSLGTVNFLFDKSQVPYMRADELADLFGVNQSTAASKARQIRDLLGTSKADPKWWRPSKMEDNPMAWWVIINGLAADARSLPLPIQEELVRRKIIPFVPGKQSELEEGDSMKNP